ncbi:MAG: alpha amylase C-terminal domain-containing protein, partial [Verrucomicrobiota bacterium]|nr:alpha amylase C-terminal domain-containing protein [Verrucomicrobiota bacterium]
EEPANRVRHFDKAVFAMLYHYNENFVLPLSHDEVVHLKRSLLSKMPGDDRERLANLRLLLGYQWTFPGKQLLFMGGELGQADEWSEDRQLDWPVADEASPGHRMQSWVRDLNRLYRAEPALWEADFDEAGFQWVNCNDRADSVLSFLRRDKSAAGTLLVVINFGPFPQSGYRVGVPVSGRWEERLNSDAAAYGGGSRGNNGGLESERQHEDGFGQSLLIQLPPLALVAFRPANLPLQ